MTVSETDNHAEIRRAAEAILAATSATLNPSPDVAGCPGQVARLAIPAALRAYADAEHHFGEAIAQRVDGTGTESDAAGACGASWGEDGCSERERLLAVAELIERGAGVDNPVDERREDRGVSGGMALDDATELLRGDGVACACTGIAPGDSLCGCQLVVARARQLQRGAHIVARQLADLRDRRGNAGQPGR